MQVLVISKNSFVIYDFTNVSGITYANNAYTINGTSYSKDDYIIMIVN